jgi:hypothetical protein
MLPLLILKRLLTGGLLKFIVYAVLFTVAGFSILALGTQIGVAQETTQQQTAIQILDENSQAEFIEIAQQGVDENTTEAEYRAVVVFYRVEAMNLSSGEEEAFESYITEGQDEYGLSVAAVLQDYRQATSPDPAPPESDSDSGSDSQQGETDTSESDVWNTTIKEYGNGLRIHSVEYLEDEGVAEIHMSVDPQEATGEAEFVITDGTLDETGDINRIFGSLYPGQREVYRIDLHDVSHEQLTIDSNRTLWQHVGETDVRYDEEAEYPILIGPVAGVGILFLMVGLQQLSTRYRTTAKNPIEG